MKILVIQTAFIGDLVMSTPIFRALHELYPDAEIHALTIPASAIILKHSPFVKKVILFNKRKDLGSKITSFFSVVNQLRAEKYDIAVSIQHSITSSLLMLIAGIKIRIGNQRQKFLTHQITIPKGLHNRQRVLSLLGALSDRKFSEETEIFLSEEELEVARGIIEKHGKPTAKIIVIAPGSVRKTKKWQAESYSQLAKMLVNKGMDVYFIGGSDEKSECAEIIAKSECPDIPNLAGELNLLESAALISLSDLLICNDSSPLHLANAVKTDVFAFFGPTVRRFGCYPYRPKDKMLEVDLDCRPCHKHGTDICPLVHHNCMKMIKPDYVAKLVVERLGKS